MTKRFEGKTALVTGAAGGIGAVIVQKLRAEGARVAVADRDVKGIEAEAHLPGNLLEPTYADGLAKAARDALGSLDIVINNAGVITRGDVVKPVMLIGRSPSASMSKRRSASRAPPFPSWRHRVVELSSTHPPAGACGQGRTMPCIA